MERRQRDFQGLAGVPSKESMVLVSRFTVGPAASGPSRRGPNRARVQTWAVRFTDCPVYVQAKMLDA